MNIDFSFMDGGGPAAPAAIKDTTPAPPSLQRESEKNASKINFALEAYRKYQDAIKATETLQNRIMHGLHDGEPVDDLFLLAIEALGLATGDGGVMLRQAAQILEDRKQNADIQE